MSLVAGALVLIVPPALPMLLQVRRAGLEHRDRAISLLTELCLTLLELPPECDPQVTLLRVVEESEPHELVPFSRAPGKVPDSRMTTQQGIAGKCYRAGKIVVQHDVVNFFASMVDVGFTEEEARQFRQDRKTYLCVPVFEVNGKKVIAVLSCDASQANVFTEARVTIAERLTPFFARLLTLPDTIGE